MEIKMWIKEFSSEQINIQYSYTLSKGGVAIHTEIEKDIETFEKEINNIFPCSSCTKPPTQTGFTKVVIKNINLFISSKDIKFVDKKFNQNWKIRRFHSSVDQKPLPIISISCHSEISSKLLIERIDIFGKHYNYEQYKKTVIHYFNCQQFEHIAKHCSKTSLCHNCGSQKHKNNTCCNPSVFVYCNKEGHPSTSTDCPTFLSKKIIIQNETSAV